QPDRNRRVRRDTALPPPPKLIAVPYTAGARVQNAPRLNAAFDLWQRESERYQSRPQHSLWIDRCQRWAVRRISRTECISNQPMSPARSIGRPSPESAVNSPPLQPPPPARSGCREVVL